jgi:hypothetical protein
MKDLPDKLKESLRFYMPFDGDSPNAEYARGSKKGEFSTSFHIYKAYLKDGVKGKALALVDENMIRYKTARNISKDKGSIALWLRPLFDWDLQAGRIIFDMTYDKGDITGNPDPSQRMALVYSGKKGRRWRLFISTDRNYYLIGTNKRRDEKTNPRSRFFVASGAQSFKLGEWMHFVATWDKDSSAFYVNGKLEGWNKLNDGTLKNIPEYFSLGAKASWMNANALSYMDEFMIFDRPLNGNEVKGLYESYGKKVLTEKKTKTKKARETLRYTAKPKELQIGLGKFKVFDAKGKWNTKSGTIHMKVKPEFDSQLKGQFIFLDTRKKGHENPDKLIQVLFNLGYRSFGAYLAPRTKVMDETPLIKTGQRILSGARRFPKGEWIDLTLTWNAGFADFYINGKKEGSVKLNEKIKKMPDFFTVGSELPPDKKPKDSSPTALLKELIIYDGALTDKEIKELSK